MLKKKLALILTVAMMATAALSGCGNPHASNASTPSGSSGNTSGETSTTTPASSGSGEEAVLATGGSTGTYYGVGSGMCTVLNPIIGDVLNMTTASTGASKENVQGITDDKYQLAILQSDVLSYAHNGQDMFEEPETDALWVAGLYNETVQITARGGLTDVSELKGKTVCVGDRGSGTEFNARQVLEAYGMTYDDINVSYGSFGEASEQLKNGQIDAAFTVAGAPTVAITELATSGMDFSMISLTQEAVDYLTDNYPFLVQENLPVGTYDNVNYEVTCVAVQAVLVASVDLSEDSVYELTKALFENQETLVDSHTKFELLNTYDATKGISVPVHPGALKYYVEAGVLDEEGNQLIDGPTT